MQMVASAKMRKPQLAALSGRPYANLMNEVLAAATQGAGDFTHPLMERREVRKRSVILISSDKGLCGGLNTNLLREATRLNKDTTVFVCAGRKGAQWVARLKRDLAAEFAAVGATRVGISADPVDKQAKFADQQKFDYPLLSDTEGVVASQFGVKRGLLGKLMPVKRTTFVIDTDRTILAVIASEFSMDTHADKALETLRKRQSA